MTLKNKLLSASGAAEEMLAIEDVFSTYLYTGNGSTQTITNGIDLAGEGGLVWLKNRSSGFSLPHGLTDTERGFNKLLVSNTTGAEITLTNLCITGFNSDGFGLGTNSNWNNNGTAFASWTFRKAPRFFDVVTYTGDGTNRAIPHNLGTSPGAIAVKRTDSTGNWTVWHRSLSNTAQSYIFLNNTNAEATSAGLWNNTAPDDTAFYVGGANNLNESGATYVAYLFAHDPLGPSGDGSDGLIACGSYVGDGGAGTTQINLGWEPQFVIIKNASAADNWGMFDNMRGMAVDPNASNDARLIPNASNSEDFLGAIDPTATGFKTTLFSNYNTSGQTYIYIAIRRGPMRAPESGTEVFAPVTSTSAQDTKLTTGFPVDMQMVTWRTNSVSSNTSIVDRLRGVSTDTSGGAFARLISSSTAAEATAGATNGWDNTGFRTAGAYANISVMYQNFRRAPEFFDVVAYTGDGAAGRDIPHNLGVTPEMIVVKKRSTSTVSDWAVYHTGLAQPYYYIRLNLDVIYTNEPQAFDSGNHTDTTFSVGTNARTNGTSGATYIAYLFASKAGVSKVGSYTGNGTSQTIDCGFTTGARFVLIKRTDSTGDWYVWDTARGIVTGNDPHLSLNTTAAEVTTDDSVDPSSVGFIVNQVAATNINVNAASYIFLAIA